MAPSTLLPRRRTGTTISVTIGGERFDLTTNADETGALLEVLVRWGKAGSTTAGLMELYAIALSVALQHGVPLGELVRQGLNLGFAPCGRTDDPDIPYARSVIDWVSRRLALDWLPRKEQAALGITAGRTCNVRVPAPRRAVERS